MATETNTPKLHGQVITVTGPGTFARRSTLQAMGLKFDGRSKSWTGVVDDSTGIYEFKLRSDRGSREAVTITIGAATPAAPADAWKRETPHGAELNDDF